MQRVQVLAVQIAAAAAGALADALPDLERRQVSAAAPNQATDGLQPHHAPAPDLTTPDRLPTQTLAQNGNQADPHHEEAAEVRMAIWQPDMATPAKAPPAAHVTQSHMGMATPPAQVRVQERACSL